MERRYKRDGIQTGQDCVTEVWSKQFHIEGGPGIHGTLTVSANGEILSKMNLTMPSIHMGVATACQNPSFCVWCVNRNVTAVSQCRR